MTFSVKNWVEKEERRGMSLNGRELKGLWQTPMTMEHYSPGCILRVSVGIFLILFSKVFFNIIFTRRLKSVDIDTYLKMDHYKPEHGMWSSVSLCCWAL